MNILLILKNRAVEEKPALLFFLKLLILGCLLKIIFYFYNYGIAGGWSVDGNADVIKIVKWALFYDTFSIAVVLAPLLIILSAKGKYLRHKNVIVLSAGFFSLIFTFLFFLNSIDIFYYRFHLQRADADLLYVLRNPFLNSSGKVLLLVIAAVVYCSLLFLIILYWIKKLVKPGLQNNGFWVTAILLILFLSLFFEGGSKKLLPNYPLTDVKPVQLPLVQNSIHNFIYSLYRSKDAALGDYTFMPFLQQQSLFSMFKKNNGSTDKKNIVLFIMESVPLQFFDSNSRYKTAMPFLDSLVNRSTYYSNAFSYSYSSNKGITAILAGIPTITDIPLYHSKYTSIKRTSVGTALAKNNYSSAFFIGDNYDDFGFAKCSKWLGIQQYYSMEDIPGYRHMEKHSMGLQDEYVLNFVQDKISLIKPPFFAVQYNISTHYPYDLPATFKDNYPAINNTAQMKSMQYYNDCLEQFFRKAASQPWYNNTVFIFCSDHWAQPDAKNTKIDEVESFRIPLFIYEPANEKKIRITSPVSQLDILNTVLYYGGVKDSIISYGFNLKDSLLKQNRTVFTKTNSAIYQAINEEYVLGFNALEGKAIYCFAYKKDPDKKNNLLHKPATAATDNIILQMKAFLQTASNHYRGKAQ